MSTDLTVVLEHRPGELARLGEITGEAGISISIRGLAAFTGEGRGVVHVLLDGEAVVMCRAALGRAGIGIADEREVLVVDVEDRPLALGELTRQLADANVNVDLAYTAFGGVKIVIATDDLESARAALQEAQAHPKRVFPPGQRRAGEADPYLPRCARKDAGSGCRSLSRDLAGNRRRAWPGLHRFAGADASRRNSITWRQRGI